MHHHPSVRLLFIFLVYIILLLINNIKMANGNRLETMTIEDQLNIFAGIDVNIQVRKIIN